MNIQNRDFDLVISEDAIGFYEREFYPFSNFSSFTVLLGDTTYMTAEHAYHAYKFRDGDNTRSGRHPKKIIEQIREHVVTAPSAHEAFVRAHRYEDFVRVNWDEIKRDHMYRICIVKYYQHDYVAKKLHQTGDLLLVEDSPKDSFWGIGPDGTGRNELGKIWMRIREETKPKED